MADLCRGIADGGKPLALEEFFLQARLLRDVADKGGVVRFLIHRDFGDRQLNGEQSAVLPFRRHRANAADGARFAGALVARDILVMLGSVGLGHQPIDLFTDDLLGAVAEDALGGAIEQDDAAAPVDGDHRVLSGGDQIAQPGFAALDGRFTARPLDRFGEDMRDRLEEMNIFDAEGAALARMRAEDAEGELTARNHDAHAADNAVLDEQRRAAEAFFGV